MFFNTIVGQIDMRHRLIQSVRKGFIPHAQLFVGQEGTGTLPLALAYARYLHCTSRKENDSCGVCLACRQFDKGVHPDMHYVFPIINKKGNKESLCNDFLVEWYQFIVENPYGNLSDWLRKIGGENAQGMIYARESDEIARKLSFRACESDYKVVIIWLPEKMHEMAANKLLKLLEEPSEKTVFLLVSEELEKILTTIRSRTQILNVPLIADIDLIQILTNKYDLTFENIQLIVRLSNGNYAKAVRIIDTAGENEAYLDLFITIMRNAWTRNVLNMKVKAEQFATIGRDRQKNFFAYAQHMIRENFLYHLQIPEINYMNCMEAEFSTKFHHYINDENVISFMEELSLAERHIEANVNPCMIFFDLSMKFAVLLKK